MHDRLRAVVWCRRLLGPVVVTCLVLGSSTARADTARPSTTTAPQNSTTRWWGPLRLGGRPVAVRYRSLAPTTAAPIRVATGPARRVARSRPGGAKLGQRCASDGQCVEPNTICERRRCVRIKRTINVMWLFYRSADRRYTSVLGLYHHRKGTPGLRIMAPFYFHLWSKDSDTRVVLPPFFVQHKNRTRGSVDTFVLNFHHHRSKEAVGFNVWPFLFTKSYGKKGFSFSLLPLVHYSRRGKAWSMYLLLFPPWYVSRKSGQTTWAVFPFAAGKTTRRRSFTWVFPLNFYWRKNTRRNYLFFPLYFGQSRGDRTISMLLPLYWYYRKGDHRRQFLSPLISYSHDRRRRRWFLWWTAPPILFSRRPGRSVNMILPLFFHRSDRPRQEELFVFPALLSFFHRRGDRRTGLVAGLFSYRRGPRRSHTVLFPLFWRFRDHQAQSSFTMVGNVYLRRDRSGYSGAMLPLLYFGRSRHRSHQILFPLLWRQVDRSRGHSVTQVLTAYWWRRGESFGHGLFPLYGYERRYSKAGYVSSKLGIFPLLYHANDRHGRLVVTPLGGYVHDRVARRRALLVGNVFWLRTPRRTAWGVVPLLFHYRDPGRTTTVVFPLYWRFRPRGGWKTDLLLPVFALLRKRQRRLVVVGPVYSFKRPGARMFGLAPLLFVRRGRRLSYFHLFPLVWHQQNHARKTGFTVVGPVFHYRSPSATYGGVVPAVFWHADPKRRRYTVWSGPFLYHQRRSKVLAMVAPLLYFHRHSGTHWSATVVPLLHYRRTRHTSRLWTPLFGFGVNRQRKSHYGYVGPVGWSTSPKKSAQVVFPLFWRFANREAGTTSVAVPPLYFGRTTPQGRTDVVLPLFVHRRQGPRRTVVLFPLVYSFSDTERKSRTLVAFPFYYWRRKRSSGGGLLPLVYVRSGADGARDVTVVPLVHVRKRRHSLAVFTPLFGFGVDRRRQRNYGYVGPVGWSRTRTKNAQVVFPLFWRFANKRAGRTTVAVVPLLTYHYNHRSREHRVVSLPGLYVRSGPTRTDVVWFPLLWHFGSPERSSTVVFPLYWDFRRGHRRRTVLFPVYWRFASKTHVRTVVCNTYYSRHRTDSTFRLIVLPILEVARKRPGDIKVGILGGLFGYERIGRNRYLKLFFARIRLKPLPAQRGLAPPPRRRPPTGASFFPI
jgi:hypothetical protein